MAALVLALLAVVVAGKLLDRLSNSWSPFQSACRGDLALDTSKVVAYAKHMPEQATERSVRLFKNGRNQAVRIPREFELPGENAIMRKEGQRLIIEPAPPKSLLAVLATLKPLREQFPSVSDPHPEPVDL